MLELGILLAGIGVCVYLVSKALDIWYWRF